MTAATADRPRHSRGAALRRYETAERELRRCVVQGDAEGYRVAEHEFAAALAALSPARPAASHDDYHPAGS